MDGGVKLKPDLVIYEERRVAVIDIQIINDQYILNTAHENKIAKYRPLLSQLVGLRAEAHLLHL